jgi:hypothetical protein
MTSEQASDHAADRVAQWLDGSLPSDDLPPPDIWACVEIFGHRKHYGRVREVERFGTKMLRVDVPSLSAAPLLGEAERFETFLYGGAAIFSFTPMTEAAARKWAEQERPRPIRGLDRLPAPEHSWDNECDEDAPF